MDPRNEKSDNRRVEFVNGSMIDCTVTRSCSQLDRWFKAIYDDEQLKHHWNKTKGLDDKYVHRVSIGLNVKIAPHRKVVLLQLCYNTRCILFKIDRDATSIPLSTRRFFSDCHFTFVGVGIEKAAKWLEQDYKIRVSRTHDPRKLAGLREAGQRELMQKVLGITWEKKSKEVRDGDWEGSWPLSKEQVDYACCEAYASHRLGRRLLRR